MTDASPPAAPSPMAKDGARFAVVVLTAMNLLNYVDRYVPSAVKPLVKDEFGLTETQTSVPLTAFTLVYMFASPLFGALADKWPRRVVIALGVALWSLATGAAAFATGFVSFLVARALVGVGEAAYATLAPAVLSDFYPPERRNRVLTVFYVAIPVGAALGFVVGGAVGDAWGWRNAFLVCGLPGLVFAYLALRIRTPGRGTFDADAGATAPPWARTLRLLAANRTYVLAVAGYTAVTFANGIMADWYATHLTRQGMSLTEATSLMGTVVVIAGIAGTAFGGWLGDRLVGRTRHPYFAMCAATMALGTAFAVPAVLVDDPGWAVRFAGASQFFLWAYNGPINTILVNCVSSGLRARAFSLSIFAIHALGDAVSPAIAGAIADATGSLRNGMLLVPAAAGIACIVWGRAWRSLPGDDLHAVSATSASR